jgi:hypothetical protein
MGRTNAWSAGDLPYAAQVAADDLAVSLRSDGVSHGCGDLIADLFCSALQGIS